MVFDNSECFEFGDFTLYPRERLLTRFNKTIVLTGKDFDILVYFVQSEGALVRGRDIMNAVWGDKQHIHKGNLTNHISKIRKALNCDSHNPRFIKTFHGEKAYRFITRVTRTQKPIDESEHSLNRSLAFNIESHLIAPVFLGQGAFENIRGPRKETPWASYKEFKIDNGRLCVLPGGMGVWQLTEKHQFSSFTEVAIWRNETYDRMLNGKHIVQLYNEELKFPLISRSTNTFGSILGKIGYIFSILALEPKLARHATLRKSLQVLSCLSPLEGSDSTHPSNLERQLLDGTFSNLDTMEFGSPGRESGFASWDGLSYLQRPDDNAAFKDEIIEFEIAVQATWWLSKCLYDIYLSHGSNLTKELKQTIEELKWQYAKLQGFAETESTARRTMIEAILATSRLPRLVEDTIRLYGQL